MRKRLLMAVALLLAAAGGTVFGATVGSVARTVTVVDRQPVQVSTASGSTSTLAPALAAAGYKFSDGTNERSSDRHRDIRTETWLPTDTTKPTINLADGAIETVSSPDAHFWCGIPQAFNGSVADALVAYAQGHIATATMSFLTDQGGAPYADVTATIRGKREAMRCYRAN